MQGYRSNDGAADTRHSVARNEAFASESRRGASLAILAWLLWFLLGLIGTLSYAFLASRYHAAFRLPKDTIILASIVTLLLLPLYFLATRSRQPLLWCALSLTAEILIISQLKFFWLWTPAVIAHIPMFVSVRYGEIQAFFIMLAIYALPLSRRLTAWGCAGMVAIWAAGIAHAFVVYPHAAFYWGPFGIDASSLRKIMDPEILVVDFFAIQTILLAVFAWLLALSIGKGRRFVASRLVAEADTRILKRFFAPEVATRIANDEREKLQPARRFVAIMFVGPESGDQDLAGIEARFNQIEAAVFANGGTVDRFTGGPAMAVFGALQDDAAAAEKTLACAHDLAARGIASVALHAGMAVCGDVGGTQCRAFSVVGDAVNTSRRILDVAANAGAAAVASAEFLAALPPDLKPDLLEDMGDVALRGRAGMVRLWSIAA